MLGHLWHCSKTSSPSEASRGAATGLCGSLLPAARPDQVPSPAAGALLHEHCPGDHTWGCLGTPGCGLSPVLSATLTQIPWPCLCLPPGTPLPVYTLFHAPVPPPPHQELDSPPTPHGHRAHSPLFHSLAETPELPQPQPRTPKRTPAREGSQVSVSLGEWQPRMLSTWDKDHQDRSRAEKLTPPFRFIPFLEAKAFLLLP